MSEQQKELQLIIPLKDGNVVIQDMPEGSALIAVSGNYEVARTPNGFLGLKRVMK